MLKHCFLHTAYLLLQTVETLSLLLLPLQNQDGEVVLKRKVKAVSSAITAFDIGPAGRTIALGTSEGADVLEVASMQS
jgi:hypothetical protein